MKAGWHRRHGGSDGGFGSDGRGGTGGGMGCTDATANPLLTSAFRCRLKYLSIFVLLSSFKTLSLSLHA